LIQLRQAGVVISVRGAQGGYQLAKPPAAISLGEILAAVGERFDLLPRHSPQNSHAEDWVTFAVWNRLSQKMHATLYSISLEDLYFDARSWQAAQGAEASFIV
jgi:Rrf2 family protein